MRSCIGPGSCARPGPWRSDVLVVMKRDATKDQIDGVRIVGAVPYSAFETAIKNQLNATP